MGNTPESEIQRALATAEASGAKPGSAAYVARALSSLPGVTRCEVHDCKSSPYLKSGEVAIVQLGAMSPACVAGVLREALPAGVVLLGNTVHGEGRWFSPQQWDAWNNQKMRERGDWTSVEVPECHATPQAETECPPHPGDYVRWDHPWDPTYAEGELVRLDDRSAVIRIVRSNVFAVGAVERLSPDGKLTRIEPPPPRAATWDDPIAEAFADLRPRPDGFDQHRIDQIKVAMLATERRR